MLRTIPAGRIPRATLAIATTLAITVPYAAPFQCREGDCCAPSHPAEHMQDVEDGQTSVAHHGGRPTPLSHHEGPGVTDHSWTGSCPMMVACGTVNVAVVWRAQGAAPFLPILMSEAAPTGDVHSSRLLPPLTPPPRA